MFWLAEDAPSLTAFVQAGPRSAVGQRLIAEKRVYQLAGPFEVKLVSQTELTVYVEVIFGPLAGRQLVTTRSSFAP